MNSVDVIVPCYRYGRYLRQCVNSVLTQGIQSVRILVLDDCSPDDTPAVGAALADEDPRVIYRRHEENLGHIRTYNEGIEWAEAEYLLLLSADDYLLPGALLRATALLEGHPAMSFCFGDATVMSEGNSASLPDRFEVNRRAGPCQIFTGAQFIELCVGHRARNLVPTPTAVVRTQLLKRLGGYRPELPHSADLELWLRLSAHGPVGYVRANQAVYRLHAQNMSKDYSDLNVMRDLEQRLAAFEAFLSACSDVLADPRRLRSGLFQSLARDAVGIASTAFNNNRPELSMRLSEFACQIDPSVRRTGAWCRLALKRRLGLRVSSALQPAVAAFRRGDSRSG
ncbi:MAG: glycosyltransferase family 2 protein [Aromatoleum sp.]|jgi:glycosyltransferase involved in cell wall biosynthesis|uniref:glycosyltransferase family 2 protein n=1 Tax=Aromatoleum sp. TaxID=2307007 RepID=UPI002895F8DA|nr:glycosyltransferase family 2 protein [Aromatoleum sp.]MDT3669336.1 glycosyltransferase family 2 protein [Aromatoleum sp.]